MSVMFSTEEMQAFTKMPELQEEDESDGVTSENASGMCIYTPYWLWCTFRISLVMVIKYQ